MDRGSGCCVLLSIFNVVIAGDENSPFLYRAVLRFNYHYLIKFYLTGVELALIALTDWLEPTLKSRLVTKSAALKARMFLMQSQHP